MLQQTCLLAEHVFWPIRFLVTFVLTNQVLDAAADLPIGGACVGCWLGQGNSTQGESHWQCSFIFNAMILLYFSLATKEQILDIKCSFYLIYGKIVLTLRTDTCISTNPKSTKSINCFLSPMSFLLAPSLFSSWSTYCLQFFIFLSFI